MGNRSPVDPADITPVERGIPLPPKMAERLKRYRFDEMEPGDSFTVPANRAMSLRSAATRYRKLNPGWDYVTATEGDRARVWRLT